MNRSRRRAAAALSPKDARAHEQLKALAWLLDNSIRLPGGFRVGIDPLLGLIPFFGDVTGLALAGYIVTQAARRGVPRSVLMRMMMNVAVDAFIGLVPVAGDVFDAGWKANQRNVELLGQHLENPPATAGSSRRLVITVIVGFIVVMALLSLLSVLVVGALWTVISN